MEPKSLYLPFYSLWPFGWLCWQLWAPAEVFSVEYIDSFPMSLLAWSQQCILLQSSQKSLLYAWETLGCGVLPPTTSKLSLFQRYLWPFLSPEELWKSTVFKVDFLELVKFFSVYKLNSRNNCHIKICNSKLNILVLSVWQLAEFCPE